MSRHADLRERTKEEKKRYRKKISKTTKGKKEDLANEREREGKGKHRANEKKQQAEEEVTKGAATDVAGNTATLEIHRKHSELISQMTTVISTLTSITE